MHQIIVWRRKAVIVDTSEPLHHLDRRYYAPLILLIGLGYLALLGSVLGTL